MPSCLFFLLTTALHDARFDIHDGTWYDYFLHAPLRSLNILVIRSSSADDCYDPDVQDHCEEYIMRGL